MRVMSRLEALWRKQPMLKFTAIFPETFLSDPGPCVKCGGREVFYRTEAEQEEKHRQDVEEHHRQDRAEFEKNRADWDRRVAALPAAFQKRIDKFRTNNPDFRWKYEKYELFVCEEAVKLAKALGSVDAIRAFSEKPYKDQLKMVSIDSGHNGNTFGMACKLAVLFLSDPEGVVKLHGALAPLVGSEEYGCVPRGTRGKP